LVIAPEWVERVKSEMPELPAVMAARFESVDGLPAYDATMMTQSLPTARYYEAAKAAGAVPKLVANWVMGEISKRLNAAGSEIDAAPVGPELLAKLIARISDGTISNNAAKQVFEVLWSGEAADVDVVIEAKGLKQVSDTGAIEAILDEVLAANPKSVDEYRAGKDKAFNALVGQAMKATKGKANPALVNELLKKKLG
jgi:aspartyl-tRNA(Asn)/glutamyl-tRNA(Gln) amidotransferase subunit B